MPERLADTGNPRRKPFDPTGIEWIKAEGAGSRIFDASGSRNMEMTLEELERLLLVHGIMRISGSVMVNLRRISELRFMDRLTCEIVMKSGRKWCCRFPFVLPLQQYLQGRNFP